MARTKKLTAARIRKAAGKSKLLQHVAEWVVDHADGYGDEIGGPLKDLFYGGCASGMVSHLIYTRDTVKFARKHMRAILALAIREAGECGDGNVFTHLGVSVRDNAAGDADVALNWLAWYGFETAARVLADRIGYED